jgi:orotidine-5'-phosphate decarboxylase
VTIHDPARRRIIVALDVPSLAAARRLVRRLAPHVATFKVGKQLFVAAGPEVVRMIHRHRREVFLDLKFHDIPHTVASAVVEAARLGVRFVDVHAQGGPVMLRAARDEVARACRRERLRRPTLLAVTVLTSMDDADLTATGVPGGAARQVVRLARLAARAGFDGVVASPREIAAIRRACGRRLTIVTPGVRPAGAAAGDQKRVRTPGEAVAAGADYVVVGRPVLEAADPAAAVRAIAADIRTALRRRRVTTGGRSRAMAARA